MASAPSDDAASKPAARTTDAWQFLITLNKRLRPVRDPVERMEVATRMIGEHLGVNRVVYGEMEGSEFVIRQHYVDGVAPIVGRGQIAAFGEALLEPYRRGETVSVDDVRTDPRFKDSERSLLLSQEIAALVVVTVLKEGRWVAGFGVHHASPRVWTADEIALIEMACEATWAAATRAGVEDALHRSDTRQAFLLSLSDAIRPLKEPGQILASACRLVGTHLRVNRVVYGQIDGSECTIVEDYVDGVTSLAGRFPWTELAASRADEITQGRIFISNDTGTAPRTVFERETLRALDIGAYVVPILVKEGRLVGAFGIHSREPRVWTPDEITLTRDVADRVWDAIERTRAEAALRKREQRLRVALEASGGGSWTWEAQTQHIDWDDGFRVRYGFALHEPATFDGWLSRVHDDDRQQVFGLLEEVLHTPTKVAWDNSFRIVLPDGAIRWIQSLGRADRDASGAVTRLTGLELDITEHRRMEDEHKAQREEDHNRELRLLLETATQGIVSVDAQGTIVMANRALEMMFGWAPGDLIGSPIERLVPSAARAAHARHRSGYFAAPHARLMGGDLNLVGERKDGSTFPIEVSLNHVATAGGGHAIAFVTDITDRQRVDMVLQERTAELERRTTQLSQMASDLTLAELHAREQLARTLHDGLQQLLVSAVLNVERHVRREAKQGAEPAALLVQAKRDLDRAITDARTLSYELSPPTLHAAGLPAALMWLAEKTQTQYGMTVEVSADPNANAHRKDVRTLLFESVRELLLNAVKYAKVDRVRLDLTLNADDTLGIAVTDQGVGFDPAELIDRANAGQAGWGLFSIRERLTLLGGRLEIDSAPGRGTRFLLTAPRGVARHAPQEIGRPASDPVMSRVSAKTADPASVRALRIVVVDDHPAVLEVLRELIEERPELRVVGDASNGLEAIAHAHVLRPDVILMDVSMPQMNGIEATRRIRAELPFIQIFGISTEMRTHGLHAIEQAGAMGFFTKGVDMQRLLDRLVVIHATTTQGLPGQPSGTA